jgi:hypothetical protein
MDENRRPIKTRSAGWAERVTAIQVKKDISPNHATIFDGMLTMDNFMGPMAKQHRMAVMTSE